MPPNDPLKPAVPAAPVSDTAKLIRELMAEMLPALAAAQSNNANRTAGPRQAPMLTRCQECEQFEAACGNKHVQMVVWPASRTAQKYFVGVRLNGVNYASAGPGHSVTVPAQNNIRAILETFERGEEDLSQGRQAEHYSGVIGPNGSGFKPATMAWR